MDTSRERAVARFDRATAEYEAALDDANAALADFWRDEAELAAADLDRLGGDVRHPVTA